MDYLAAPHLSTDGCRHEAVLFRAVVKNDSHRNRLITGEAGQVPTEEGVRKQLLLALDYYFVRMCQSWLLNFLGN